MSDNVLTPEFRVSYPYIFKPQLNDLNKKMEYSLEALFKPGADLSKLKAAAKVAAEKKFGKDQAKWPKNLRLPFRDQSEKVLKDKETGQPVVKNGKTLLQVGCVDGATWMRLKSERRPGLVDQSVQDIVDETQFFAGCWARATVQAYAYDQKGNRGVSFELVNLQKLRDDEPFGRQRTKPADDFSAVEDGGSAESVFDEKPAKGPLD